MDLFLYLFSSILILIPIFILISQYVNKGISIFIIIVSTYLSYNAVASVLFSLASLKITPISLAIFNIVLAGLMYLLLWKKQIRYEKGRVSFDKTDWYAIILTLCISSYFFIYLYSTKIDLKFLTTDPSVHFIFSKYFSETGRLLLTFNELMGYQHMSSYPFLAYVNTGIWMGMTDSIEAKFMIYLISNFVLFFLIILAVYSIYKKLVNEVDYLQATILIGAASIGYNLNSIIFGFTSQLAGIFIALVLILICDFKWSSWAKIIFISLNLIGLFYAYYYFIPAAMISLLISNSIQAPNMKWTAMLKALVGKQNIIISLITVTFGGIYLFILNKLDESGNASTIKLEGFIYRELYSDFKPYLLFAVLALFIWFKNRINPTLFISVMIYNLFAVCVFLLGMAGDASSYYFYKNYYLIENLLIVLFCFGLYYVKKSNVKMLYYSYILVLAFLAINTFFIDEPVQKNNNLFNIEIERNLTKVQDFNKKIPANMEVSYTKVQRQFMEQIAANKDVFVGDHHYIPVVGNLLQQLWFYSYTEIWPKYGSTELRGIYEERVLDYSKWKIDLEKNPYIILLNNYDEWLSKEKVDLSDFETVYEVEGAVLIKYIK